MVKARERLTAEGRWDDCRAETVAMMERRNLATDGSLHVPGEYSSPSRGGTDSRDDPERDRGHAARRLPRLAPHDETELWVPEPDPVEDDRMALAMIGDAERDALISPGDTIVEYTAGSTGLSLALVCTAARYRSLIVSLRRRRAEGTAT